MALRVQIDDKSTPIHSLQATSGRTLNVAKLVTTAGQLQIKVGPARNHVALICWALREAE